jgi:hypothetical protein
MLEVKNTATIGRGVFATKPIARGTRLIACGGWLASTSMLQDNWFAMQVDADQWLCSLGDGIDDCINHSCDPNAGFLCGDPVLYALRDIAAGEQITWDYSTSLAEPGWALECLCGSPKCRGIIRSWGELSADVRRRLLPTALQFLRSARN